MDPDDTSARPLLVDIDRALMRTELARESFWVALGRDFRATLRAMPAPPATRQAAFANIAAPPVDLLPLCPEVAARVTEAVAAGRTVTLFSGAGQSPVDALANRLGLSGMHFGLEPGLRDSRAEVEQAMLHNAPVAFDLLSGPLTGSVVRGAATLHVEAANPWPFASLVKELRPHQWAKNLLLLLPLISAQMLFSPALFPVLVAMLAFCAGASAIYVVNDLLDLEADRLHPQKRFRPIAAGTLPIGNATRVSIGAALMAVILAALVSPMVAGLVVTYMLISLVYSLHLKSLRWIDLGALVALYLLRVGAGAVAAGVGVSPWLGASVAFIFLTLAVVKRLTALVRAPHHGHLPGRGYTTHHTRALYFLGLAGAALSVTTFLAYCHTGEVAGLYTRLWALKLASMPVALWLVRILRLSLTGQEDFDPLVFVAHDRGGLTIIAVGVGLYLLAL